MRRTLFVAIFVLSCLSGALLAQQGVWVFQNNGQYLTSSTTSGNPVVQISQTGAGPIFQLIGSGGSSVFSISATGVCTGAACGGSGSLPSGTLNQIPYISTAPSTYSTFTTLPAVNFPALTGNVTTSAGSYATTIGAAQVVETMLNLTNNTTANVSTSAHGLTPILPNVATQYLSGIGTWTVPSAAGSTLIGCHYASQTGNYTIVSGTDCAVELKTNAGTFTLPTAVSETHTYVLINWQTTHTLTINTTSSQNITGSSSGTTYALTNGAIMLTSDNVGWRITGDAVCSITAPGSDSIMYYQASSNCNQALTLSAPFSLSSGTLNLTIPATTSIETAVCQGSVASLAGNNISSLGLTAACISGTNVPRGAAQFPDTAGQYHFAWDAQLPHDFTSTGGADFRGYVTFATDTTVGHVFQMQLQYVCNAGGAAPSDTWSTAANININPDGTVAHWIAWSLLGTTLTGCSADQNIAFRLTRSKGTGSDTATGAVNLLTFQQTVRRGPIGS